MKNLFDIKAAGAIGDWEATKTAGPELEGVAS
jgi:hypothetical protein